MEFAIFFFHKIQNKVLFVGIVYIFLANILPSQKTLKVSDKKVVHPVSNSTQTIASNKNSTKNTSNAPKPRKEKVDPYECPNTSDFTFFPTFCTLNTDCFRYGKEMRCCKQFNSKRCVKGVPKPIVEQRHERN